MRVAAAALVVCVCAAPARAEHGDPGYRVWPDEERALPTNGRVALRSSNGPHPFVTDVMRLQPRLVGGGERIAMRRAGGFRGYDWGGYGDSAVLLAPARRLRALTEYSLCLRVPWGDGSVREICPGTWTTGPGPDRGAPTWTTPPRTRQPSLEAYHSAYELAAADDSALFYTVTARAVGRRPQRAWLADHDCMSLIFDVEGDDTYDRGDAPARTLTISFGGFDPAGHQLPVRGVFAVTLAPEDNLEICLPAAPPPPSWQGDGE